MGPPKDAVHVEVVDRVLGGRRIRQPRLAVAIEEAVVEVAREVGPGKAVPTGARHDGDGRAAGLRFAEGAREREGQFLDVGGVEGDAVGRAGVEVDALRRGAAVDGHAVHDDAALVLPIGVERGDVRVEGRGDAVTEGPDAADARCPGSS